MPSGGKRLGAGRRKRRAASANAPGRSRWRTPGNSMSPDVPGSADLDVGRLRLSARRHDDRSERAPSRPLRLKHEEILPRQERMGGNQRIARSVEFRDGFSGGTRSLGGGPSGASTLKSTIAARPFGTSASFNLAKYEVRFSMW